MDFAQHAQEAGKQFLETNKDATIRIISHFDTDGLCSCAILEQALAREGYNFTSTQVPHLDNEALDDLTEDIVFFLDLGANKVAEITKAIGRFLSKTSSSPISQPPRFTKLMISLCFGSSKNLARLSK